MILTEKIVDFGAIYLISKLRRSCAIDKFHCKSGFTKNSGNADFHLKIYISSSLGQENEIILGKNV